MKKNPVLAGLAAVALSATLVPALALADGATNTINGTTESTTSSTEVKYTVNQSYTWTVPTEIVFDADAPTSTKTGTVEVTKSVIENGKTLNISLGHENTFTIKSGQDAECKYTVSAGDKVLAADANVLEVEAGVPTKSQELTFKLDDQTGKMKAGTYTGTLSYLATIN